MTSYKSLYAELSPYKIMSCRDKRRYDDILAITNIIQYDSLYGIMNAKLLNYVINKCKFTIPEWVNYSTELKKYIHIKLCSNILMIYANIMSYYVMHVLRYN